MKLRVTGGLNYSKVQWISSFEDVIVRLRPHLTARIPNSTTGMAWHRYRVNGENAQKAAEQWSVLWASDRIDRPRT